MIVEGQVHGGLADGIGMALMELIAFDEDGNNLGGSFMDYLLPTAMECPDWELGETVTPSPHHPIGAKGVGRVGHRRARPPPWSTPSSTPSRRSACVTRTCRSRPANVWRAIQGSNVRTDMAVE